MISGSFDPPAALKFNRKPVTDERIVELRKRMKDECRVQFVVWAESTSLDIFGIYNGEPVFRPAICAWEAWKAAWSILSSNLKAYGSAKRFPLER